MTNKIQNEELFKSPSPEDEQERLKERSEFDPDEILVRWVQSAQVRISPRAAYDIRLAKFKNGRRGLQLIRGGNLSQPHHVTALMLHPDEYYTLAQCIFRDSGLIKELCIRFPEGTDATIDRIRDFVRGT
jgi:hypothetical protein